MREVALRHQLDQDAVRRITHEREWVESVGITEQFTSRRRRHLRSQTQVETNQRGAGSPVAQDVLEVAVNAAVPAGVDEADWFVRHHTHGVQM